MHYSPVGGVILQIAWDSAGIIFRDCDAFTRREGAEITRSIALTCDLLGLLQLFWSLFRFRIKNEFPHRALQLHLKSQIYSRRIIPARNRWIIRHKANVVNGPMILHLGLVALRLEKRTSLIILFL